MGARSRPPVRRPSGFRPRSGVRPRLSQQRKRQQYDAAKTGAPAPEQQVAAAQEQIATQAAKPEPFEGLLNETASAPVDSGSSFGSYPTQPQDTRSPQALPGINRMAGGQNLPQTLPALNRSMAGRFGTGGTGAYGTRLTPGAIEDLLARAEANAQTAPQRRTASRRRVNYTPRLKRRSRFSSRRRRF